VDAPTLVSIALVAFVAYKLSRALLGKVDPARARALVEGGAKLVDVRTPTEHAAGHIQGSINIPVHELASRTAELGDKTRPVVVYCASGMRSASAVGILKRAGFTEVHDLGAAARWG